VHEEEAASWLDFLTVNKFHNLVRGDWKILRFKRFPKWTVSMVGSVCARVCALIAIKRTNVTKDRKYAC